MNVFLGFPPLQGPLRLPSPALLQWIEGGLAPWLPPFELPQLPHVPVAVPVPVPVPVAVPVPVPVFLVPVPVHVAVRVLLLVLVRVVLVLVLVLVLVFVLLVLVRVPEPVPVPFPGFLQLLRCWPGAGGQGSRFVLLQQQIEVPRRDGTLSVWFERARVLARGARGRRTPLIQNPKKLIEGRSTALL